MFTFPGLELRSEGAEQFPSGKGHFSVGNGNLYLNFAKGTTRKAHGITANAVGYLEACISAMRM